jgi:protein TonB
MLSILSAAAVLGIGASGVPLDPGSWVTPSDYPAKAMSDRAQGNAEFRLSVDTSGRADACGILASSGSQELDVATCELILARARFKPAIGPDGKPVRFEYSSAVRWTVSDDHTP